MDNFGANNFSNNHHSQISNKNSININTNSYSLKENSNYNTSLHSSNLCNKKDTSLSINLKHYIESQNKFRFVIPSLIHPEIAQIKMRDLVAMFRNELLVFDLEKRNGIVFNLPDIIQCGMFGICGIAKKKEDLFKLLESSINLVKNIITRKDNKNFSLSIEKRSDIIDANELLGRIKYFIKNSK